MAKLGDKVPEEQIVANSENDFLYTNETEIGTYHNIQTDSLDESIDKKETFETLISPKIRLSIFCPKGNGKISTIELKKFKKIKGGEWAEDGKIYLSSGGAGKLEKILELLSKADLSEINDRKLSIGETLEGIEIDEETGKQLELLFKKDEGEALFQEIIDTPNISKGDIIGIGYKKDQLDIFRKLLDDPAFFTIYKSKNSPTSDEGVWQHFFEHNQWIFGYGLNYIWLEGVKEKMEQVVAGYDFNSSGKRIDGLLSTISDIKKFVLVEIKKHDIDLLGTHYRKEAWAPGIDLCGGISQLQKSVNKFKKIYFEKVGMKDDEGNPIDDVFNITPKSYLIIGRLNEFMTEKGVNIDKYSSFELYRESLHGIEIITYDELYERARYIIEKIKPSYFHTPSKSPKITIEIEDLPF